MGAGASVPDGPMDEAAARAFFGDEFSAEQFEEMADPSTGTITAEQVRNLLAPVGAEMGLEGGEGASSAEQYDGEYAGEYDTGEGQEYWGEHQEQAGAYEEEQYYEGGSAAVPAPFVELFDDASKAVYYMNTETHEAFWTLEEALAAAATTTTTSTTTTDAGVVEGLCVSTFFHTGSLVLKCLG